MGAFGDRGVCGWSATGGRELPDTTSRRQFRYAGICAAFTGAAVYGDHGAGRAGGVGEDADGAARSAFVGCDDAKDGWVRLAEGDPRYAGDTGYAGDPAVCTGG